MSKTLIIQKNILEYLKEKIGLQYQNLKFYEFFLPKVSGMVKKGDEEKRHPILLMSPLDEKKEGIFKKRAFRIILAVEGEDDQKAAGELFKISESVIETLEKNSLVPGKFAINSDSIKGEFRTEECGDDYWVYSITFLADILTPRSKILEEKGF